MENKYKIWETREQSNNHFELCITIELLKNNIGQILTDLINTYKFYYSGLEISEDKYLQFKHNAELNLVLSEKYDFNKLKNTSQNHLSKNYLKDIVEIVIFELIESCQIIFLLNQLGKGYNKQTVDCILSKYKKGLNKEHLPKLIDIVENDIGQLNYRKHILSINDIRRRLVHRNGLVDIKSAELLTRTLKIFTRESFTNTNYALTEEDKQFVDFRKVWNLNDLILLEYLDCYRILFTVISFFNDIINKLTIKYPALKGN